jgi:hypothetical protein
MRINIGTISKLGDESTKQKIIELAKENPKILKEYESWLRIANIQGVDGITATLNVTMVEPEEEPTTKLIPKRYGQKLDCDTWDEYTPYENKLEIIDGEALWGDEQRDKMLLVLVYNMGLEHFVNMLPEQSKVILKALL